MHTERDINIFVCVYVLTQRLSAVLLSAEHSMHFQRPAPVCTASSHGGCGNLEDTWGHRTRQRMAHRTHAANVWKEHVFSALEQIF